MGRRANLDVETVGVIVCLVCLVCLLFLVCGGAFIGCDATYSEGYRDGVIQKFSQKGIFFKSWEGELAQFGFKDKGENVSNTFAFSVDDQKIIDEINALTGAENVRLHYKQLLFNAYAYHSTDYRIVRIERLQSGTPDKIK